MAQWINFLWSSSFVNPTRLPLSCEKSGAQTIVERGFTSGRHGGRQTDRQMKLL